MANFLEKLLGGAMKKDEPQANPGTIKNGQEHAPSQGEIMKANAAVGGSDAGKTSEDKAKEIWGAKPIESPTSKPVFQPTDPQALQQAVSSINFAEVVPAELMTKAAGGDAAAMMEMMNLVARAGYSASAESSKELLSQHDSVRTSQIDQLIEQRFKQMMGGEAVKKVNPAFENPKYAPMLDKLQKQFQAAYPNASPQELANHAQKFMEDFANDIYTGSPEGKQRAAAKTQAMNEKPLAAKWLSE